MDVDETRIIHDAIEAMQSEAFSKSILAKRASNYGTIACGVNVYLVSHMDADVTYSATSVHCCTPLILQSFALLLFQDLAYEYLLNPNMFCSLIPVNLIV